MVSFPDGQSALCTVGRQKDLSTIFQPVGRDPVPFTVSVPEETIQDLRRRLEQTRFVEFASADSWSAGVPVGVLQGLIDYWLHSFDWRAVEDQLATRRQMILDTGGLRLHFVHQPSPESRPLPLVLVHGWPSSFLEMLELADLLSDPVGHGGSGEDAFDVVIPSLPGFGFSDKTWHGPWALTAGEAINELMMTLGYEHYGVHTHDVGASVMTGVCLAHPDAIIGYHTTEPGIPGPYPEPPLDSLTSEEREYQATVESWLGEEGGYLEILRTRSLTIGHALHDSPGGLAAWIAEKWWTWSVHPDGDKALSDLVPMNLLVANIALYWHTETIHTANWIYSPRQRRTRRLGEHVGRPVGVTLGAQPIERAPRVWAERFFSDVQHWANLGRGGHFLAAEEPQLLAESIRRFFRPMRGASFRSAVSQHLG